MTRIAIMVGSTRTWRQGGRVGRWVVAQGRAFVPSTSSSSSSTSRRSTCRCSTSPRRRSGDYTLEHTRRWAETIAGYDGFVFVVGEHNHSFPASLKNAIDHLFAEWNDKAAGFVGYGVHSGGAVAIEQLRVVLGELRTAACAPPSVSGWARRSPARAPRPGGACAADARGDARRARELGGGAARVREGAAR